MVLFKYYVIRIRNCREELYAKYIGLGYFETDDGVYHRQEIEEIREA